MLYNMCMVVLCTINSVTKICIFVNKMIYVCLYVLFLIVKSSICVLGIRHGKP